MEAAENHQSFQERLRARLNFTAPAGSKRAIIEAMKIDLSGEEVKLMVEALEHYYA